MKRRSPKRIACALDLCGGKVALLDRAVLVDEAVVRGDDDVAGVGAGQLLHQPDDLLDRLLGGLENLILGRQLVADGVDQVVIDVERRR